MSRPVRVIADAVRFVTSERHRLPSHCWRDFTHQGGGLVAWHAHCSNLESERRDFIRMYLRERDRAERNG